MPRIHVHPTSTLVDEQVHIELTGFEPNSQVTVRAVTDNILGLSCEVDSHAVFLTDNTGSVNLASACPISGTYQVADGMGLFWSMTMKNVQFTPAMTNEALQYDRRSAEIHLVATSEHGDVAEATCERRYYDSDVIRTNITDRDLVGKLFLNPTRPPAPAVIVLGGGEGGMASPMTFAALLASHGYPSLALAYFGFEHLPNTLREIPLEYFRTAVERLRAHPQCDGQVIVYGRSKGAELALLLGATDPHVSGVISSSPTSVVSIGDSEERSDGEFETYSSWSQGGKALPFVPWTTDMCREIRRRLRQGQRVDDLHAKAFSDVRDREQYDIPVERTQGPVLLISSGDDHWWPAAAHAERVMTRLAEHGFTHEHTHVTFKQAGHVIRFPHIPTTQLRMNGGSPKENHNANLESWEAVLAFLQRNFPNRATTNSSGREITA